MATKKARDRYKAQRKWKERNPWARYVEWARRRCGDVNHRDYKFYGALGIKVNLSAAELKSIWERDGAAKMVKPSLDRIDSSDDYFFENVRFIEHRENSMRPHL